MKHEDRSIEIIKSEERKEKIMKNIQRLRNLRETFKQMNVLLMRVSEEEKGINSEIYSKPHYQTVKIKAKKVNLKVSKREVTHHI